MTPQNAGYAIAAYTCAALIYVVYASSVILRTRRLRARLSQLDGRAGRTNAEVR